MGITQLVAQVTLTRELLALFFGNELSIALVLAVWLTAVAAGSAGGSRIAPRLRAPLRAFAWSQMALACLLPLSLLTARRVHPGHLTPGQVLGPGAMLLTSLYVLALVCLIGGFQFVLAARAAAQRQEQERAAAERAISPIALVYALEAAGAVLGGIAFHCYLSQHVVAFRSFAALGLLNTISGAALLRPGFSLAGTRVWLPALLLAGGLAALFGSADKAELASVRTSPRWSGLDVLSYAPSKYGALVFAQREGQLSAFQSGVLLFTLEDHYANEVTAHLPLLEHPEPRRVMLIGGALAGLPAEVLKHPVQRLDCVELDPLLVDLGRSHLPSRRATNTADSDPLQDSRVHLHLGDGRLLARKADALYDVIIVNVPDPTTASLNRFYTTEFFQEAESALAPGGLLAITLTGSSHLLSGSIRAAAATTDKTLGQVFPNRLLVPGEQMFFLATQRPGELSSDWRVLAERLRDRGISTDFVNEAWLKDALLPFRAELIREQIRQERNPRVNTDLNPISYHHQTRVWVDQLSPVLARPLRLLSRITLWWAAAPLGLALLVLGLSRARARRLSTPAILIATMAIGGFGLVVEVLALLAFQSACGYLYHALGALIAAFMAGLAIGSALISARDADRPTFTRLLLAGLATAVLISALLPRLLAAVLPAPRLAAVALGLLLLLVGSLVGAMFPVATALYRREQTVAAAGGAVYAADLVGSAGATVIASVVAVPHLGAAGTCYASALFLAAALLLALTLVRGGPTSAQPIP